MFLRALFISSALISSGAQAQDATSLTAEVRRALGEYRTCVVDQAVRLGEANSESAETILRAVASRCLDEEVALERAYGATPISEVHRARLLRRDREEAENDAIAALLEARAAQ